MEIFEKEAKDSIKLFPLYYGLSADLIFWAAISTLFLVSVKKFSSAQINLLNAISVLVCIIGYFGVLKCIKKIGNLKSVKIGNILLLFAAVFITFSNTFWGVLVGFIFYKYAFLLKSMDNVILRNNLKYLGKENLFFKYQTKGTLIYSIVTLFIALISGYIFNVNNYLPMYISIFFCVFTCVIMNFIKEFGFVKTNFDNDNIKIKLTKNIIVLLLFAFFMYALLDSGQLNSKLIIQERMNLLMKQQMLVYYFGIIIFVSRIFRVIANILFAKIFDKTKRYMAYILNISFILCFIFIIVGNYFFRGYISIILMSFGFVMILSTRDAVENYCRTVLLENCDSKHQDSIATYYYLARVISTFLFSSIISLILLKFSLGLVFVYLLITSLFVIFITIKTFKIVNR